jgi:hypothetical protein
MLIINGGFSRSFVLKINHTAEAGSSGNPPWHTAIKISFSGNNQFFTRTNS